MTYQWPRLNAADLMVASTLSIPHIVDMEPFGGGAPTFPNSPALWRDPLAMPGPTFGLSPS